MSSAVQSRKIALPRALSHGAKREKSGVPRAKLDQARRLDVAPYMVVGKVLLLLFNTTRARARTTSGPPSTGAAIAMDGGVADLCCGFCSTQRARSGPPSRSTSAASNARCGRGAAGVSVAPATARTILATIPYSDKLDTCRASSSTCQMSTLENVPQLARVVRCVVRVLYTL